MISRTKVVKTMFVSPVLKKEIKRMGNKSKYC